MADAPVKMLDQNGNAFAVPADQAEDAAKQGLKPAPDIDPNLPVKVKDRHGNAFAVPAQHLGEAVERGYNPENEELADKILQTTTGEKVKRAATAAAYGAIQSTGLDATLSTEHRDQLKALAEHHPIAHGAGMVAGAVLGPVGEVGSGIRAGIGATTLGGRILASGAAGAAENALFGAGDAIDEASLGDAGLNAESLAAHMGLNSILGFGFGGVGQAVGEGLGKVGSLTADAVSEGGFLGRKADEMTLKALSGGGKAPLKPIPLEERGDLARFLRENELVGRSPQESLDAVHALQSKTGAEFNAFKDAAGKAAFKFDPDAHMEGVNDWFGKLNPVDQEAIKPEMLRQQGFLDQLKERGQLDLDSVNAIKASLQKDINYTVDGSLKSGLKKQLVGMLKDNLDNQLEADLGPVAGEKWAGLKKSWQRLRWAEDLAEEGVNKAGGNRTFSLGDRISGVVGGHIGAGVGSLIGGPIGTIVGGGVGSLSGALMGKVFRERGPALISDLVARIEKSAALGGIASHLASDLPSKLSMLGEYGPILGAALSRSPAEALATHIGLSATEPAYRMAAIGAGYQQRSDDQLQTQVQRMATIATVGSMLQEHKQEMGNLAKSIVGGKSSPPDARAVFGRQDFGEKRMRREDEGAYEQRTQAIQQLAANPQAIAERAAGNMGVMGDHLPATSAALAAHAQRAVSVLAAAIPKGPVPAILTPKFPPTQQQMHQFSQVLEAVENPHATLRRAAAGALHPAAAQALKQAYPRLSAEVAQNISAELARKGSIPAEKRLIAHMFGVDADGSLSPASVFAAQTAHALPSKRSGEDVLQSPKPPGRNQAGLSKLKVASRARTMSQRADQEVM